MRKQIWTILAITLVLGAAPLAADQAVSRGVDLFTTPAGGSFYDFSANPIPADFFCLGSPAFDGRIGLRGVPLVSAVPGQLRGADTVVQRLDDAVFDAGGVARTRVRVRALSLVGTEPVRTPCGTFQLHVTLAGKQPITLMEIVKTSDLGGVFHAPIDVEGRLRFIPLNGPAAAAKVLELTGSFSFPAGDVPWSFSAGPELKQVGTAVIDVDGDRIPETRIGGASNFAPGWSPDGNGPVPETCRVCEPEICHEDPGKEHCTGPIIVCMPANCP